MSRRALESSRVIAAVVVTAVVLGSVVAIGTGALPVVQVADDTLGNLTADGEVHVAVRGGNATATGDVPIGNEPPTIESAGAVDRADGNGNVRDGDVIGVSATVTDPEGIERVVANASAFGAGTLTLADGDGDGTYTGNLTVNASAGAGRGTHAISVTATDTAGHTRRTATNALKLVSSTSIASCTVIDESGYYELTSDVTDSNAGACLTVTAGDVTIDGGGHTVDGIGDSGSVGIRVAGSEGARVTNVTVRNVELTNWANGINATYADDVSVEDVTVSGAGAKGIALAPVGGTVEVRETTVRDGVTDQEGADAVFVRGRARDLAFTNLTVADAGYEGLDVGFRSAFNIDLVDGNVTVRDASFSETGRTAAEIDVRGTLSVTDTEFVSTGTERFSNPSMQVTSLRSVALQDLTVRGGDTYEGEISASAFNTDPDVDATVTVSDVSMDRVLTGGLYAGGDDRATIRNVTVTNGTGGVTANAQKGPATVRNVTLHNVSEGITASAGPGETPLPEESAVLVANATVRELGGESLGTGLELGGGDPAGPITVRDTTVSGGRDGAEFTSPNVTVRNLSVANITQNGISVNPRSGALEDRQLTMTGVDVHNVSDDGIRLDFVRSADLTRVNLTEIGGVAIRAYRSLGTLSEVRLSTARIDGTFRNVEIDNATSPGEFPANWTDVGTFIEAGKAAEGTSFEPAPSYLNASFRYDGAAVSDVDERSLSVWRHDGSWTQVGGTVDRGANAVSANLTDFSTVAPLAVPSSLGLAPGNLSVRIDSTTSPVNETRPLVVEATVENTGDVQGAGTITMSTNGTERDAAQVTLPPGESRTVTLSWQTVPGDAGTYDLTVAGPDGSASTTVDVVAPTGPRPVGSCKVIEWPGSYVLTGPIETNSSGPCIEIAASDVAFDGGGNAITGAGDGEAVRVGGEGVDRLDNVTVRDVTLTDWQRGVYARAVDDVTVEGVTVRNASAEGLLAVLGGGETAIRGVTVENSGESAPAVSVRGAAGPVDIADLSVGNAGTIGLDVGGLQSDESTDGNVTITDAAIRGAATDAIRVLADGRVTAENVTVDDAGGDGITTSAGAGVSVTDALIEGATTGITPSTPRTATVTNTTVRGTDTALSVPGGAEVSADGLTVDGRAVPPTTLSFTARTSGSSRIRITAPDRLVEPPDGNRSVFRFVDVAVEAEAVMENVTVAYDDADAGNLEEASLRIWRYGSGWTALGGSVDAAADTVTIDRITDTGGRVTLAPLGTASVPEPTVTDVDVAPTRVDTYETATATVTVDNPSGRMIEAIELTDDGAVLQRSVVRLDGGTTTVTFDLRFYDPRVLTVSATGTTEGETVTVREAPDDVQPPWGSWHLQPDNDNHEVGLEAPRPPLSIDWNTTIPERDAGASAVPMKTIVVDDTLFAYSYQSAFAMDARTGEVLWNNARVNGTYLGGMAHADGRIFVSTYDDGLYALNATDGSVVWNREGVDTIGSAPVVLDGTVFVGGENAVMWALSADTGETVWNHSYATNGLPADFSSPTAANGRVFVPNSDGRLYVHDAENGSVLWTRAVGYTSATPAVRNGIVYVADADGAPFLQAFDADTGETVWTATADFGYTGLAVAGDTVFLATCGNAAFAYDAATGERRWTRPDVGCAYDVSEPVAAEGVVYLTNYDNETLAVDQNTGETLYTFTIPGDGKPTSPVPYRGRLYVASRYTTGEIYALAGPERPRITPDTAPVNASTTLTVLGEYRDEPLSNATVTIDGTTLQAGADGTVEYTFGSAGRYEVTVGAENTTGRRYLETTRVITVGDAAAFSVAVDSTNAPVTAGGRLDVTATVTNDGTREGTRNVTLDVGGSLRDAAAVSLEPGESTTVTLSWTTGEGDAGEYTAAVSAGTGSDSTAVSVVEPVDLPPSVEPIDACTEIATPGRYALTGDLSGSETCIDVTTDDVVVDGRGHVIEGSGSAGVGIRAGHELGVRNVTITDLTVRDWGTGVQLRGVVAGRVSEVRTNDTGTGIDVAAAEVPDGRLRYWIEPSAHVAVRENTIVGANGSGIVVDRSRNLTIGGNTVRDANGSGIALVASEANTLVDNTVTGNAGTGITVAGRGLRSTELTSPTPRSILPVATNNTATNNTATENGLDGFRVHASENNTLRNNTARDNDGNGIGLSGGSIVPRGGNNTVLDNAVIGNNASGISITGVLTTPADDNDVRSNLARANNGSGIFLLGTDENEVRDNRLIANNASGVTVFPSATANQVRNNTAARNRRFGALLVDAVDTVLVNNTATENGAGGFFLDSDARAVTDNTARGNDRDGFLILAADEALDGNTATDNARHGFRLRATNVTLQGGTATANGADGVSIRGANGTVTGIDATGNDRDGIQVRLGDGAEIRNSVTNDNGRHGVLLNGSVEDGRLVNNTADGNDRTGFALSGPARTAPANNTLSDGVARNNGAWAVAIRNASGTVVEALEIGASTEPGTTLSFEGENVAVGPVAAPPANPDNESLGRYVEAEATGPGAFLDLELGYTDADASGIDEGSLAIQRYDGGEWLAVNSTPDPAENVVAANVTEFSTFGAFGAADDSGDGTDEDPGNGTDDGSGDAPTLGPGQPGFGVVLVVVALLLFGLLARRQR